MYGMKLKVSDLGKFVKTNPSPTKSDDTLREGILISIDLLEPYMEVVQVFFLDTLKLELIPESSIRRVYDFVDFPEEKE